MTRSTAAALALLAALAAGCSRPRKTCGAPAADCGGACVDLALDAANCGGCGSACPAGKVCAAGACADACAAPLATCVDGATAFCAAVASDPRNCGTCGHPCADGSVCAAGACAPACASPLALCAVGERSACVDLRTDALHCGACATRCRPDEVCSAGACASACGGATPDLCGGVCTALAGDAVNCGACGHACGAGEVCSAGACADPCALSGGTRCGGACTSLATDAANCGACGRACPAPGVCVAGQCAPPACAGVAFAAPALVTTVESKGLLVRDLDLDGKPDLVVTHFARPAVQILRGLGGGRFGVPEVHAFGVGYKSMAAGDVDGDGLPDLAFVDPNASLLTVLRNAGPAGFLPLASEWTAFSGVALGDLDGDGRDDLVLYGLGGVEVRGSAGVTWRTPGDVYSVGAVAIADMTGDGRPDLVVGRYQDGHALTVFANAGDGTFAAAGYADGVSMGFAAMAVADLDGDGNADVAVWAQRTTSPYDQVVALFRGDGAGGLSAMNVVATLPWSDYRYDFLAADLDGDGDVDLAVGEANVLRVFANRGDGTFEPERDVPAGYPQALAAADVDGDGIADVLAASAPAGGVEVFRGTGGGAFATSEVIERAADHVAVADLDRDGRGDVVAVDASLGTITVLRSTPAGLGEAATYASPGASWVVAGDLDGDGIPDLVVAHGSLYGVADAGLLRGRGDGTFDTEVRLAGTPGLPSLSDVNGDGVLDLVLFTPRQLVTLLGRGDGTFSEPSAPLALEGYVDAFAGMGDVDGDGLPDAAVLWSDFGDVRVRVYRSRGDGTFDPTPIDISLGPLRDPYTGGAGALLADLDGDGLADLAVHIEDWIAVGGLLGSDIVKAGAVLVFHNAGGAFAAPARYVSTGSSPLVAVARTTGVGRRDLVVADHSADGIAFHPANGDGTLGAAVRWALPEYAESLAAGDVDGDGRDDLVVGGMSRIAVLRASCR